MAMTTVLALNAHRRTNTTHTKEGGEDMFISYSHASEYDEYDDIDLPPYLGRRRPNLEEWDDLVLEAQLLWVEVLADSKPEPAPKRGRPKTTPDKPKRPRGRPKGSKNKPKPISQAWLEQYLA